MTGRMSKLLLDIIVTHHNEPWEVGKKFFDMLSAQRDVDFDAFRVIIVQDGKSNSLPWSKLLCDVPYTYKDVIVPKHSGPSAARNAGIDASGARWIMFCDFDDTFTNICSLKLILNVLDDMETEIGWFETWREEKRTKHFVNVLKENPQNTFGKIYKREMLVSNNLRFNESLMHCYESMFNDQAFSSIPEHRIKKIAMPFAAYMKTLRKDSYNNRKENLPKIMNELLMSKIMIAN